MTFTQQKEYTCGPAALQFFLYQHGYGNHTQDDLEKALGTDETNGTSPIAISEFLTKAHISHEATQAVILDCVTLPMLVNYWTGEDGHWGNITELHLGYHAYCTVMDPDGGTFVKHDWPKFVNNWYSKRNGQFWGIYLRRDIT